jgi:hypothetical protein
VKAAKSYSELDSTAQKIAARAITPRPRAEKNRRITPDLLSCFLFTRLDLKQP